MGSDEARSQSRVPQGVKFAAAGALLVGISLAVSWSTTSPPRQMWFEQKTVTVTQTTIVSPWWMEGFHILFILLLVWMAGWMVLYGPRVTR